MERTKLMTTYFKSTYGLQRHLEGYYPSAMSILYDTKETIYTANVVRKPDILFFENKVALTFGLTLTAQSQLEEHLLDNPSGFYHSKNSETYAGWLVDMYKPKYGIETINHNLKLLTIEDLSLVYYVLLQSNDSKLTPAIETFNKTMTATQAKKFAKLFNYGLLGEFEGYEVTMGDNKIAYNSSYAVNRQGLTLLLDDQPKYDSGFNLTTKTQSFYIPLLAKQTIVHTVAVEKIDLPVKTGLMYNIVLDCHNKQTFTMIIKY